LEVEELIPVYQDRSLLPWNSLISLGHGRDHFWGGGEGNPGGVKTPSQSLEVIPDVAGIIRTVRKHRVILDSDLAKLYGVETKQLNRAVKRNLDRFPDDFMFQLSPEEVEALRCQFGTSNEGRGGAATSPMPSPRKTSPCSPAC
jgi:hypothetical protein